MPTKRPRSEMPIPPDMPPDAIRLAFATNLKRAMIQKGWTQSELARRAAPYAPDKRMIRDNISKYMRGKVLPGPLHLQALAKALGVSPDDLLPIRPGGAVVDHPTFSVQQMADGNVWLRINQAVPMVLALKIAAILEEHG